SDNGKQFTDRFGKGGEVLFDRICRTNGIIHRLTQPASPTTTGKIERWHHTLERELIDHCPPFRDIAHAQAVIDEFVAEYNHHRPHQSLNMRVPAALFDTTASRQALQLIPLRLPASLGESLSESAAAIGVPAAAVANELELPVVWPTPDPQVLQAA